MVTFKDLFNTLLKNWAVVVLASDAAGFVAFCRAAGYFVLPVPAADGASVVIYR